MTEEEMPEMQPVDPMSFPPAIRVNLLMNEMMNMVDHMTQLKAVIDETMAELMQGHEHTHVHDENCDHDHDEIKVDDDCCGDPDCESKEGDSNDS